MIQMLNKRRNAAEESGEEGFTLIELMVVVLIIGILLAIAVPTFLSAQKNAKSKAATSNLRSALSAAKTVYADKQSYVITLSDLRSAEPSLGWGATENAVSAGPETVSWDSVSSTQFIMAVESKLGDCFFIKDDLATDGTGGTTYGKTSTNVACAANLVPTSGWDANPSDAEW